MDHLPVDEEDSALVLVALELSHLGHPSREVDQIPDGHNNADPDAPEGNKLVAATCPNPHIEEEKEPSKDKPGSCDN